MPLFTKKEKILALDLVTRNVKQAALVTQTIEAADEAWHPFVQITNVHGRVVGRSKVLPDHNCRHTLEEQEDHVVYPTIRLSCDQLGALPSSQSSSVLSVKRNNNDSPSSLETQPLLITVYAFNKVGKHLLFGKVLTTMRDLLDHAHQLKRCSPNNLRDARPSLVLANYHRDKLSSSESSSSGFLYVKRAKVTNGIPDKLSQVQFSGKKKDFGRIPYLSRVRTPKGLPALEKAESTGRLVASLLGSSNDETDILSDSSSSATNGYDDDGEEEFVELPSRRIVGHRHARRNLRSQEAEVKLLLEETKAKFQAGLHVNVQILQQLVIQLRHEMQAQQQRMTKRRTQRLSLLTPSV
uniref:Uncharacterized protein n=1 Tax=Amphora coffeiformis TaxID=265554 RepID=A0A7S3LGL8_9STRA|mmetsp:Transcript_161/g.272  ORF Transcript_161/g.272 Transcript_161/m.272 type:complete len:353 (-) Transcript_161:117-1175(-)|eukprot:scaffold381_cov178-Amphora_coffeaeformis.AAC.14